MDEHHRNNIREPVRSSLRNDRSKSERRNSSTWLQKAAVHPNTRCQNYPAKHPPKPKRFPYVSNQDRNTFGVEFPLRQFEVGGKQLIYPGFKLSVK